MTRQYTHLDSRERTLIYWWLKDKHSLREIARRLNRSHTSISREIRRNKWFNHPDYTPRGAQRLYEYRLKKRAERFRLKAPSIRQYVSDKLSIGWTPEIISGRLKCDSPNQYVCHESIYQYIYIIAPELVQHLPRKHRKRKMKKPYRTTSERIKNRVPLASRPLAANDRSEYGHWESDSIVSGDRQHGLNVLVERKSRLTHISILKKKTANATDQCIRRRLKNHKAQMVQSITYDNGSENTLHENTSKRLDAKAYFCKPYHSWEKGAVEQVNGLIRRFLPKGSNFSDLPFGEINSIEKLLNNRPRKCLNFQTPYEIFRKASGALPG